MSRAGSEWRGAARQRVFPSLAMGCGSRSRTALFKKKKRRSMTGNGVKWCAKRGDPGGKQWVAIERAVRGEEG